MSRKMLITLIVVMAAVLAGLIFVQTSMIKNASDIKEEQFNHLVKNALTRVAVQLELYEQKQARLSAQRRRLSIISPPSNDFSVFPRKNLGRSSLSFGLSISEDGSYTTYKEEYHFGIPDSVNIAEADSMGMDKLMAFRESMQRKREKWLNDVSWRNYEIDLEGRPISERIDSVFLAQVLASSIAQTGIDLEYKYSIKNSNLGRNQVIIGNADYEPGRRKEFYQPLFHLPSLQKSYHSCQQQ